MNPRRNERGTVIRAEGEILKAIDAYADTLYKEHGIKVTRTAAAEALLRLGLLHTVGGINTVVRGKARKP